MAYNRGKGDIQAVSHQWIDVLINLSLVMFFITIRTEVMEVWVTLKRTAYSSAQCFLP